jgi:predicted transcriptional regulator
MSNRSPSVSDTELSILRVLWDRGPQTTREIVEAVYSKHSQSLHTTVNSLLDRLMRKGYARCVRRGTVRFFEATVDRSTLVAGELQGLADSHFGGSLAPVLLALIEGVRLSAKDRNALRKIVEKIE